MARYIAQVAQSFAREVIRFEVGGGDERLQPRVYAEGAAIGGCAEGGQYCAEFAVRTLVAVGTIPVDARRTGLIEEPTDRTKEHPQIVRATTKVVGQLGQDLLNLADVFVRVREAAVLATGLGIGFWAFGHGWK